MQAQIEKTTGPEYWRSLEELAGSEEFQEMLHREFPKGASEWLDGFSRRGFLKTMGASLALAGLTGCTKMPITEIVPYVRQPENVVPGRPMFYATAFTLGGYASPILVESHLFRPTKVEGNPQHPASLGGTDVYAQASILDLYDPDRAQNITYDGDVRSWNAFVEALRGPMSAEKSVAGGGVRILTPNRNFAHAGRADSRLSRGESAGQVACLRADQPRQRLRRRETGFRRAGRDALRLVESRRYRFARRRFSLCRIPRLGALHARFRRRGAILMRT